MENTASNPQGGSKDMTHFTCCHCTKFLPVSVLAESRRRGKYKGMTYGCTACVEKILRNVRKAK